MLVLVRPCHHYITSPGFRIPIAFARHSGFVALSLDFGSKGKAFARKVVAGSAYTVSYNDSIREEGGPTRGRQQALALSIGETIKVFRDERRREGASYYEPTIKGDRVGYAGRDHSQSFSAVAAASCTRVAQGR